MYKKKLPSFILYMFVILTIISIAMVLFNKKDDRQVSISNPNFHCEYVIVSWHCNVEVLIKNITNDRIDGTLAFRGVTLKKRTKSNEVIISDVTHMKYHLDQYEEKMISNVIKTKRKPDSINITIVEKNSN